MIKINETIPDFQAEIYHKDDIRKVRLSDYHGSWVVLVFYPADFTYVCPTELEDAAELHRRQCAWRRVRWRPRNTTEGHSGDEIIKSYAGRSIRAAATPVRFSTSAGV